jgi:hypothetical protein
LLGARFWVIFQVGMIAVLWSPQSMAQTLGPQHAIGSFESTGCSHNYSDPIDECARLAESTHIAQRALRSGHPIINRVREMTTGASALMAEDGALLNTYLQSIEANQLYLRLLNLRSELNSIKDAVCNPRRTVVAARADADCSQMTDVISYYDSRIRPVISEAASSREDTSDPNLVAERVRGLIREVSCESYRDRIIRQGWETYPECGLGRIILLQAIPNESDRNRIWGRLNFRHITDSGHHIANNGYSLGGGRLGESRVGMTADCSDYVCRALTGSSQAGCPTTRDYMDIGRYLERNGSGDEPLAGSPWSGLHNCFERVTINLSQTPLPGDIVVYPGHMVFVNQFDPTTGVIETLEASSTRLGIGTRERAFLGYPLPDFCRTTPRGGLAAIPETDYHVLRLREAPGAGCPSSVRRTLTSTQ